MAHRGFGEVLLLPGSLKGLSFDLALYKRPIVRSASYRRLSSYIPDIFTHDKEASGYDLGRLPAPPITDSQLIFSYVLNIQDFNTGAFSPEILELLSVGNFVCILVGWTNAEWPSSIGPNPQNSTGACTNQVVPLEKMQNPQKTIAYSGCSIVRSKLRFISTILTIFVVNLALSET